ncbi:inorganic phosphate transporter [Microcoleus vaginatus]|uniref:inorganic phosphate transporter n=1 Tax=Microcoleus vaginatus TaxID=119532 RepID=UPI00403F9F56
MLNTSGVVFLQLAAMAALALYVAANLGANDVANSMGTSVGSKALTLRQAIIVAGILEFSGAVLFGQGVSETLATGVVNAQVFAAKPQVFLIGMVSVLIACGIWLQIATSRGLPVSSSHAVVGAIAGFSCVAAGINAVDWRTIGTISLTWVATPVASGALAALFYSVVKYSILDRPDPLSQMREWIPWLSAAMLSVFGVIVLPSVVNVALVQTGAIALAHDRFGWNLPIHDIVIGIGAIAAIGLTLNSWKKLESVENQEGRGEKAEGISTNSSPTPKLPHSPIEQQMARFQVLSACFVAFSHGSNDVGNAVAPLAAIAYIRRTGSFPSEDFSVSPVDFSPWRRRNSHRFSHLGQKCNCHSRRKDHRTPTKRRILRGISHSHHSLASIPLRFASFHIPRFSRCSRRSRADQSLENSTLANFAVNWFGLAGDNSDRSRFGCYHLQHRAIHWAILDFRLRHFSTVNSQQSRMDGE